MQGQSVFCIFAFRGQDPIYLVLFVGVLICPGKCYEVSMHDTDMLSNLHCCFSCTHVNNRRVQMGILMGEGTQYAVVVVIVIVAC